MYGSVAQRGFHCFHKMGKLNDAAIAWDKAQRDRILTETAVRHRTESERDAFEQGVAKKVNEQMNKVELPFKTHFEQDGV